MVLRPSREDVEAGILDAAAGLIAQHGRTRTTVQAVADAVGYSKAALLRRFCTKQALQRAAVAACKAQSGALLAGVEHLPPGPERDLAVVRALVDLFRRRQGHTALMVASVHTARGPGVEPPLEAIGRDVLGAFGVPGAQVDPRRFTAILGAIGALVIPSLGLAALHPEGLDRSQVADIVETSFNALGHGPLPTSALTGPLVAASPGKDA